MRRPFVGMYIGLVVFSSVVIAAISNYRLDPSIHWGLYNGDFSNFTIFLKIFSWNNLIKIYSFPYLLLGYPYYSHQKGIEGRITV